MAYDTLCNIVPTGISSSLCFKEFFGAKENMPGKFICILHR